MNVLVNQVDLRLLISVTSILTIGMPMIMLFWYRRIYPAASLALFNAEAEPQVKPLKWWIFLPFIFAIYAVGVIRCNVIMYYVVANLSSPPAGNLSYFGLIPYRLFLFVVGYLADTFGRRVTALVGAIMVGIGFMSVGLFT